MLNGVEFACCHILHFLVALLLPETYGSPMHARFLVAAVTFAASLTAHADTTSFNFNFGTAADAFSGSGVFTASSLSAG